MGVARMFFSGWEHFPKIVSQNSQKTFQKNSKNVWKIFQNFIKKFAKYEKIF